MKSTNFFFVLLLCLTGHGQKTENIIIISTDGFRWQEVFKGMDSAIANDPEYNEGDSNYLFEKYWAASAEERRKNRRSFYSDS